MYTYNCYKPVHVSRFHQPTISKSHSKHILQLCQCRGSSLHAYSTSQWVLVNYSIKCPLVVWIFWHLYILLVFISNDIYSTQSRIQFTSPYRVINTQGRSQCYRGVRYMPVKPHKQWCSWSWGVDINFNSTDLHSRQHYK